MSNAIYFMFAYSLLLLLLLLLLLFKYFYRGMFRNNVFYFVFLFILVNNNQRQSPIDHVIFIQIKRVKSVLDTGMNHCTVLIEGYLRLTKRTVTRASFINFVRLVVSCSYVLFYEVRTSVS